MLVFTTVTVFLLMSLSLSIPVRELEIEITPSSAMSAALHKDSPSYRAHVLFYKSNGNSLMRRDRIIARQIATERSYHRFRSEYYFSAANEACKSILGTSHS